MTHPIPPSKPPPPYLAALLSALGTRPRLTIANAETSRLLTLESLPAPGPNGLPAYAITDHDELGRADPVIAFELRENFLDGVSALPYYLGNEIANLELFAFYEGESPTSPPVVSIKNRHDITTFLYQWCEQLSELFPIAQPTATP